MNCGSNNTVNSRTFFIAISFYYIVINYKVSFSAANLSINDEKTKEIT